MVHPSINLYFVFQLDKYHMDDGKSMKHEVLCTLACYNESIAINRREKGKTIPSEFRTRTYFALVTLLHLKTFDNQNM